MTTVNNAVRVKNQLLCKQIVDLSICKSELEAIGETEDVSFTKKQISADIRNMSDLCVTTLSSTTAQFADMGLPFINNKWRSSTSDGWKRWLDNKVNEIKARNELSARQCLFIVAHSCKKGIKKNDSLKLYDTVRKACKKHGITLSHKEVDSIKIEKLDSNTVKFILETIKSVCKKKPLVYEHYVPVDDVKKRIENFVHEDGLTRDYLYRVVANEVGSFMTCWVSPYENSSIEHEKNREDPWKDYSKAKIKVLDIDTRKSFKTKDDLDKYIEYKNEAIKKCFQ